MNDSLKQQLADMRQDMRQRVSEISVRLDDIPDSRGWLVGIVATVVITTLIVFTIITNAVS